MTEKSTADIERDVELQRREVEDTLDALRAKLSTGQIIEQATKALTGAGNQGGELLSNLGRQVKENPIPVALTGIGLAWLLTSQSRQNKGPAPLPASRAPVPLDVPLTAYDRTRYLADEEEVGSERAIANLIAGSYAVSSDASGTEGSGAKSWLYDKAKVVADQTSHGAAYVSERMKAGAYAVSDTASSAYDSARTGVEDAAVAVRGAAEDAADTAVRYGRRAQRGFVDFVKEEPLIAAAVGVAIGAVISAALPASRTEDRLVGPHRDKLRDDGVAYATDQAKRLEKVAERTVEKAKETAQGEGLIPKDDDTTVAEKVKSVAKAADETAKEEAEKEKIGQS
ncbi:MAG: DUF3618 domain-containing protein [Pseudomonadota bacterium]